MLKLIKGTKTHLSGVVSAVLRTVHVSNVPLYSKHDIVSKKYIAVQSVIKDIIGIKINKKPYSDIKNVELIPVESVTFKGQEETYNLEVDYSHNFLVGSGFVVHNCVDSMTQLFIRVGSKRNTAEELGKILSGETEVDSSTKELADLMGWDLSGNSSGLPFNINF